MVPGFVFCLVDSSRWLRAPHGKKLGTSIYGPQFRVLSDRQQAAVGPPTGEGSADMSFPENSGKRKKLGTSIYGPQFRVLSGGSKWLSALPTGSRRLSARRLVEAAPT